MRLRKIVGASRTVTCCGCGEAKNAGTDAYISASGHASIPQVVYEDVEGTGFYCQPCAVSVAMAIDETRSRNWFYSDTSGRCNRVTPNQ